MRTVILMSGLAIAESINKEWTEKDSLTVKVYAVMIVVSVVMDLIEFLNKERK